LEFKNTSVFNGRPKPEIKNLPRKNLAFRSPARRPGNLKNNQDLKNQVSAETLAFFQVGKSRNQVSVERR